MLGTIVPVEMRLPGSNPGAIAGSLRPPPWTPAFAGMTCGKPAASLRSLLLAGDRLGLALAGAGVGVRALAADRQAAAVAQAAIAAQVHQALDVHRHVAAQVALDGIVAVDSLADLQHL